LCCPGCIIAYQSHIDISKKSGSNIFYEIGIVWPIRHYFTNFIEANRIKIAIINPDIPLLTDGRQFSVRMTVKLPAVEM